jgi:hypothetical protein
MLGVLKGFSTQTNKKKEGKLDTGDIPTSDFSKI